MSKNSRVKKIRFYLFVATAHWLPLTLVLNSLDVFSYHDGASLYFFWSGLVVMLMAWVLVPRILKD